MALTNEEKTMLEKIGQGDFYGPLIALVLFRYERRDKAVFRSSLLTAIPSLIDEAYGDLESDA